MVAIAVWLRSHSIILELKEYWTLLQKNSDSLAKNRSSDNGYGITLQQNESNRKNVSSPNKNSSLPNNTSNSTNNTAIENCVPIVEGKNHMDELY